MLSLTGRNDLERDRDRSEFDRKWLSSCFEAVSCCFDTPLAFVEEKDLEIDLDLFKCDLD